VADYKRVDPPQTDEGRRRRFRVELGQTQLDLLAFAVAEELASAEGQAGRELEAVTLRNLLGALRQSSTLGNGRPAPIELGWRAMAAAATSARFAAEAAAEAQAWGEASAFDTIARTFETASQG
jgi:hypothetical protein